MKFKTAIILITILSTLLIAGVTHDGNDGHCFTYDYKLDFSSEHYEYTSPNGESIVAVGIKAGNACHVYPASDNECYGVEIDDDTVVIDRLEESSECKEISHVELLFGNVLDTPTSTPVDTETATATPTNTPITPSATLSPTATPTATDVPPTATPRVTTTQPFTSQSPTATPTATGYVCELPPPATLTPTPEHVCSCDVCCGCQAGAVVNVETVETDELASELRRLNVLILVLIIIGGVGVISQIARVFIFARH